MESHPFTTAWEVAQELNLDHSMAVWHWKQTGKVKKFDKWVPHELSENQKYHHFEVPSFLILHNSNETLLDQILTCAKSGFYTTTSDNQLSGHTEKKFPSTSQSQACTQKMSRSLFGGLWPNSSTTAFWILAKPLHLRSMLSEWMRCTKNYTCSQHRSTERAQFSVTTPDCTSQNQSFKSWTLQKLNEQATKCCLICHIHLTSCQLTATSSSILTTFCSKNALLTRKTQKMLSKSSSNPKAWIFFATGVKLFLIGKNVLIVVVPILINKDVFEPSYRDLKFRVWNCDYFCTNINTILETNRKYELDSSYG